MLPFTNGVLTAITPPGTSADYDTPAEPGAPRWEGELAIYIAEERRDVLVAGSLDEVIETRLEIPYKIGRLIERRDTLSYTFEGAELHREAGTITRAQLVGRVRVLLEDG